MTETTKTTGRVGRPPGFAGQSNRIIWYRCAACGSDTPREDLRVKKVMFTTMGNKFKTVRSRTVCWLCESCMQLDPDYNREALIDSPGLEDVRRAKSEKP